MIAGGLPIVNGEGMSQNTVDVYLLHTGSVTWSHRGGSSPIAWTNAGIAVNDKALYIAGGHISTVYDHGTNMGRVSHRRAAWYNPIDDKWQILPSMRYSTIDGPSLFVHNEKLYSLHTEYRWEYLDLKLEYKGWSTHHVNLPNAEPGPKSVVKIGNDLYNTGILKDGYSTAVMSLNMDNEESSWSWKPLSNMAVPRRKERKGWLF